MPHSVQNTLQGWSYLILTVILWGSCYDYPHLQIKETELFFFFIRPGHTALNSRVSNINLRPLAPKFTVLTPMLCGFLLTLYPKLVNLLLVYFTKVLLLLFHALSSLIWNLPLWNPNLWKLENVIPLGCAQTKPATEWHIKG